MEDIFAQFGDLFGDLGGFGGFGGFQPRGQGHTPNGGGRP